MAEFGINFANVITCGWRPIVAVIWATEPIGTWRKTPNRSIGHLRDLENEHQTTLSVDPSLAVCGRQSVRVASTVTVLLLETMTMKRIDDSTLETVAELICGSGDGSGGGYQSPGPYRSMSRINAFFGRAGVKPSGQSATRKWFALESLQSINGTNALESVLLRLASPKEYPGDPEVAERIISHLNLILQVEGLTVDMVGVEPCLSRVLKWGIVGWSAGDEGSCGSVWTYSSLARLAN